MSQHEASRTLLKSLPELWSECSDAASLARHLGQFGEIRITRLEPETTVAWEGEAISGTVRLEPAGWGTRVILRAGSPEDLAAGAVEDAAAGAPDEAHDQPLDEGDTHEDLPPPATEAARSQIPAYEPERPRPPARRGLLARLLALFARRPIELEPVDPVTPELESAHPVAPELEDAAAGEPESAPEPESVPAPEPVPEPESEPPPIAAEHQPQPGSEATNAVRDERRSGEVASSGGDVLDPSGGVDPTSEVLVAALDSLGTAHHRPFSRA